MRNKIARGVLRLLVLTLGLYTVVEMTAVLAHQTPVSASAEVPAATHPDNSRKAQIKAIDEQIRTLREQYKAQMDPLQAQLQSLREKLDAELKSLEAQRETLVEQGEPAGLKALNEEEATQLAALADQEKAEIEKIHLRYSEQRKSIHQGFQERRHNLETSKR
jgi:chromosome segregation ATPase